MHQYADARHGVGRADAERANAAEIWRRLYPGIGLPVIVASVTIENVADQSTIDGIGATWLGIVLPRLRGR
jgi:hypothetical protein